MDLADFLVLVCKGSLFGLAVRFFLGLNMRIHTAAWVGVLALLAAPWLSNQLDDLVSSPKATEIILAAVFAVLLLRLTQVMRRQWHRAHPACSTRHGH